MLDREGVQQERVIEMDHDAYKSASAYPSESRVPYARYYFSQYLVQLIAHLKGIKLPRNVFGN